MGRRKRGAASRACAVALATLVARSWEGARAVRVIEPRCARDAQRYRDATRAFHASLDGDAQGATCADAVATIESLRTLRRSPCETVGARARFLSAELLGATGAWDEAKEVISSDLASNLSVKVDAMVELERQRSSAAMRGAWERVYELADIEASASACASKATTFQARANAALKLGMCARAFVDAKRALALGGSRADAYETLAAALSELAESTEQLETAETLAWRCLQYAPERRACFAIRKRVRNVLASWRRAEKAESSEDWASALSALLETKNASLPALRFDARVALCRVNGGRTRAQWNDGTHRVSRNAFAREIDECTDVLSDLLKQGETREVDIAQSYLARAWMRTLSGNTEGAEADVAGLERSIKVTGEWTSRVQELRDAIDKAREANAPKDLYAILGLKREDAESEDWLRVLKRAYRKMALLLHPDKNPTGDKEEAEERFDELVKAYKILSSETLRREYDETGRVRFNTETQMDEWYESSRTNARGSSEDDENDDGAFNEEEYSFKYDKRDAGVDGRAQGVYVHKETGEKVYGERDVRPETARMEDVCVTKRGYCIEGRGGDEKSRDERRAGVETLPVKIVTEKVLEADKVAARIVRNHFGLQSLDFMFVFDVELPDEEAREMALHDLAKSRLRRLVRTLHASLVGGDGKRSLTGMIEENIASSTSDDVTLLVDYVASALNGVAPHNGSPQQTVRLLHRFASHATAEMRRLGALGLSSDERTDVFVRVARDVVSNPLISSRLLGTEGGDDASSFRSLTALWRDDANVRAFVKGDVLSYEIKLFDSDNSTDVHAISAALDFRTTCGARLSNFVDAVDQFGLTAATSSVNFQDVVQHRAVNGWITRRIRVPDALVGSTPSSWFVSASRDGAGAVVARLRDVKIINHDDDHLPVVRLFHSKSPHS